MWYCTVNGSLFLLKWAVTCDLQRCCILTSVDSDEPVQPPFKLRNSKLCSVSSFTVIEYSSDQQRRWSDCAYAQAGLSICWSHIHVPHCWKSYVMAQMTVSLLCNSIKFLKIWANIQTLAHKKYTTKWFLSVARTHDLLIHSPTPYPVCQHIQIDSNGYLNAFVINIEEKNKSWSQVD